MRKDIRQLEKMQCLFQKLGEEVIDELRTRRPTREELTVLRECLSREEADILFRGGVSGAPGGAQPPMELNVYVGLTTYVAERGASIRAQLRGELPSHGDGSGSGSGDTGMSPPGMPVNRLPGGLP